MVIAFVSFVLQHQSSYESCVELDLNKMFSICLHVFTVTTENIAITHTHTMCLHVHTHIYARAHTRTQHKEQWVGKK